MLKFFHFRPKDETTGLPKQRGGTTVGYERLDQEGKVMLIAFSRCSEQDIFSKKHARMRVRGRIEKGKCKKVEKPEGVEIFDFLKEQIVLNEKEVAARYGKNQKRA